MSKATIYGQIIDFCTEARHTRFTSNEIQEGLYANNGTLKSSILPADFCYNRINYGIAFIHHLFEANDGDYIYLGPDYPYTGFITWKGINVGRWEKGSFYLWLRFPLVKSEFFRPDQMPSTSIFYDLNRLDGSRDSHANGAPRILTPRSVLDNPIPPNPRLEQVLRTIGGNAVAKVKRPDNNDIELIRSILQLEDQ